LKGRFRDVRMRLPIHMQGECRVLVLFCADGALFRYERLDGERDDFFAAPIPKRLEEAMPPVSDGIVHLPEDVTTHRSTTTPITVSLNVRAPGDIAPRSLIEIQPQIIIGWNRTELPPAIRFRPQPITTIFSVFELEMVGHSEDDAPVRTKKDDAFTVRADAPLPVAWSAIEVHTLVDGKEWDRSNAALWAEQDIMAA
jgi:hypothetical protein